MGDLNICRIPNLQQRPLDPIDGVIVWQGHFTCNYCLFSRLVFTSFTEIIVVLWAPLQTT